MACPRCKSEKLMNGEIAPIEFIPQLASRNILGIKKRISHMNATLCTKCGRLFDIHADPQDILRVTE